MKIRKANISDIETYFKWSNDPLVRQNSFYSDTITWVEHRLWFNKVIDDKKSFLYIFENIENKPIGQVRITNKNSQAIIGISIDIDYRGKGFTTNMINLACNEFWEENQFPIFAYIKKDNKVSNKSFLKAGFVFHKEGEQNKIPCNILIKNNENK